MVTNLITLVNNAETAWEREESWLRGGALATCRQSRLRKTVKTQSNRSEASSPAFAVLFRY